MLTIWDTFSTTSTAAHPLSVWPWPPAVSSSSPPPPSPSSRWPPSLAPPASQILATTQYNYTELIKIQPMKHPK